MGSSQVLGSDEYSRVAFHMDYNQHLGLGRLKNTTKKLSSIPTAGGYIAIPCQRGTINLAYEKENDKKSEQPNRATGRHLGNKLNYKLI